MDQLVQLEDHSKALAERDTVVIAISADNQDVVKKTIARYALTFPVLSDAELKVIKSYRVLHPTREIAIPVTYIIGPSGSILWRYRQRGKLHHPPIEVLLEALDEVQRGDGYRLEDETASKEP